MDVLEPIRMSDELRAQRPNISAADLYRLEALRLAAADVAPELLHDPARMTRLILEVVDVIRSWGPDELDADKETAPSSPQGEDGAVKDLLHRAESWSHDRRWLVWMAVTVCLVPALVACTTNSVGESQAAAAVSRTASTRTAAVTSSSMSSRPSSARPRQLELANVDPCGLLTAAQQVTFGVDRAPRPGHEPTLRSATCDFSSIAQKTGFGISPVTTFGIDRFQPGAVNGDVRPLIATEFPAVELYGPLPDKLDDFCIVVVDVADGQVIHVDYGEEGLRPHLTKDVVCSRAAQIASLAVANLMARK